MNKIIFPATALLVLLYVSGCSTKFNIAAPYKNITVVDGLLDEADTAHYIRIQKAFLDQNKSALTLAQNPDSNFYPNLNVSVEEVDFLNGGTIINTYPLTKVDLNLEGYQKAQGTFFNAPNYAYKFKNTLNPNYSYRILITNPSTGETDSAEAPVIDDTHPTTFSVPLIDNTTLNLEGLDFHSVLPNQNVTINCTYVVPGGYNFYGQASPVGVAQAFLTFNWLDSNYSTGTETYHSFTYNAGFVTTFSNNSLNFQISNNSLFDVLVSGMGAAPSNIGRLLLKCNISVLLGTPDYYSYMQVAETQGTGLTANEIEPIYTNIQGASSPLGLYTSRGSRSGLIQVTQETIDSLQVNTLTKGLNILRND